MPMVNLGMTSVYKYYGPGEQPASQLESLHICMAYMCTVLQAIAPPERL